MARNSCSQHRQHVMVSTTWQLCRADCVRPSLDSVRWPRLVYWSWWHFLHHLYQRCHCAQGSKRVFLSWANATQLVLLKLVVNKSHSPFFAAPCVEQILQECPCCFQYFDYSWVFRSSGVVFSIALLLLFRYEMWDLNHMGIWWYQEVIVEPLKVYKWISGYTKSTPLSPKTSDIIQIRLKTVNSFPPVSHTMMGVHPPSSPCFLEGLKFQSGRTGLAS